MVLVSVSLIPSERVPAAIVKEVLSPCKYQVRIIFNQQLMLRVTKPFDNHAPSFPLTTHLLKAYLLLSLSCSDFPTIVCMPPAPKLSGAALGV